MSRVPDSEFESEKQKIAQDIENTLERVVNDYSEHWKGVLGEFIQNSYDGWCHNRFGEETIPTTQPLDIRFEIDLNSRTFKAGDNAGGMNETTFYHNYAGLDTPGEEKKSGDFGGSYGRGSHVIAGLGEEMFAETRHDGFHGALDIRGAHQMEVTPSLNLDHEGLAVEVYDCDTNVLVQLTEWERVRSYLQSRFQPLLEHNNVTITYKIDGMEQIIEPLDLSVFDVLWSGNLEFESHGKEYTLEDVTIYDQTSASQTVPINGVAMLKRNQHMDQPFMRVQDYRPRQLRHMDKMFGVCDASSLCPEHEDNAHNSFTGGITSETGLKTLLEQLEREYFIGTPTDLDQKDDIVNTTLEVVNNQWDHNPFNTDGASDFDTDLADTDPSSDPDEDAPTAEVDVPTEPDDNDEPDNIQEFDTERAETSVADTEYGDTLPGGEPTGEENETDTGESGSESGDDLNNLSVDWADEDGGDDEEQGSDEPANQNDVDDDSDDENVEDDNIEPDISCSTRQRSFTETDEVEIWFSVENPSDSEFTKFDITAELEHEPSGELETLNEYSLNLAPGEGTTGEHSWVISPSMSGKYLFRAYLYETHSTPREKVDYTHTYFYVGDSTEGEEQEVDTIAFLEDVFLVRKDEEDFRAELNEGDHGMLLVANTRHPEYKHAVRQDGSSGTKNQTLTLIRWAHESIMQRILLDKFDDRLTDVYDEDGEPLSHELGDFVRGSMMEDMSKLMAGAHEEV